MKLVFVYNAKSGMSNHLIDALHKTFKPSTYECDLCILTYGHISPKKEWKAFLKDTNITTEFYYKDKFLKNYPEMNVSFPVIFNETEIGLKILVSSQQMKNVKTVSELITLIKTSIP